MLKIINILLGLLFYLCGELHKRDRVVQHLLTRKKEAENTAMRLKIRTERLDRENQELRFALSMANSELMVLRTKFPELKEAKRNETA